MKNANKYGMTDQQIKKELVETYKAIFIFRVIGFLLLSLAVILGFIDWNEFSSLVYACVFFGGGLVWMTGKMKSQVKEEGLPEPTHYIPDSDASQDTLNEKKAVSLLSKSSNKEKETIDLGLPQGFSIAFLKDYMKIAHKWSKQKAIYYFVGAVLGFVMVTLLVLTLSSPNVKMSTESDAWIYIFYLPVFTFLVMAVYYWRNSTVIFVSKDTIQIKHMPMPWFGKIRLDTSLIKQLFSTRYISTSNKGRVSVTYEVHIITQEGAEVDLLTGLNESNQAMYIEQEVEKYLGIDNIRVKGELYNDERT